MPDSPLISLVIAVYNKADVLRLVLAAVGRQSFREFEVIVADDGSGEEVKEMIAEAGNVHGYPITHLWHEDKGWRKNTMLNNAIRASKSEYLVFIDGDCLPGRSFLEDHWAEHEKMKVLLGRRVEMSERWARRLSLEMVKDGRFEKLGLSELVDGLRGTAIRLEDGIRLRNRIIRKLSMRESRSILGSNFSLHKEDIVAINGFDEMYDGPGHGEDSDIQYRLSLIGVKGKSLRNLAVQYHVWHPRTNVSENSLRRFEEVRKSQSPMCKRGLKTLD